MTHVTHGAVLREQMVNEPLDLATLDAGGIGRDSVSMTESPASFGHLFADLPC